MSKTQADVCSLGWAEKCLGSPGVISGSKEEAWVLLGSALPGGGMRCSITRPGESWCGHPEPVGFGAAALVPCMHGTRFTKGHACFLASGAGCTWGQSRSTGKCNSDHMHKAVFSFSTHTGAAARYLCILCSVPPREAPMGPLRRRGQPGGLGRAARGEGRGSQRRNISIINEISVAPCLPKRNQGHFALLMFKYWREGIGSKGQCKRKSWRLVQLHL